MKFIHYLERISGVGIYGLISMTLFGLIFLLMLAWTVKADKKMMEKIRHIPLDE